MVLNIHRNTKHIMSLCIFNAHTQKSHLISIVAELVESSVSFKNVVLREPIFVTVVGSAGTSSSSTGVRSGSDIVIVYSLANLCFALPRTIATPTAHLNCCSMILGYAPPFLSARCITFSKSYLISPNHPAHTGILSSRYNRESYLERVERYLPTF